MAKARCPATDVTSAPTAPRAACAPRRRAISPKAIFRVREFFSIARTSFIRRRSTVSPTTILTAAKAAITIQAPDQA
ncbi:hypothetical protein SAZ11_27520 [Streptomyces sp. FXJ1.4098]|nr:hypothetical protein [Streptomyces sp. FXJ1.4098]